ncbi:MAG: FtsQ-type POTRA domain-containing protein [Ruminococcaceae bacterium]|jgi:cell division protein FtsQ|nr:FtsQ-type POTRA domain-containing protein [Oscillospiraceae bacterium]
MPQQNKRRRKRSALFAPLSFLIICAALVFGMSVFFRVSGIEVEGNELYTAEEIIEASGIEHGDNLFFINRFSAISRIFSKLPYVEKAVINRSLPNKLVIVVSESHAIACVSAEDGTWAIDRNCKLLSKASGDDLRGLIRVEGLTPIAPEPGQIIAPGDAESPKVSYLSAILTQIDALNLRSNISYIDISGISNPSFDYLGRFTVKLGNNENIEYKFQCLLSAVAALNDGDRGTLDLSIDKRAHLTYD